MTKATGEAKNTPCEKPWWHALPREIQLQRMRRVMEEALTPRQRETLEAYHFQGLRPAEIARRQGIHRSTVARTLRRAEARLQRFLKY